MKAELEVLRPGVQTSIQDLGRDGLMHMGVPRGGAFDRLSLIRANRILGVDDNQAGFEITWLGPQLKFNHDNLVVISGGEAEIFVDDVPMPMDMPILVRRKQILTIGKVLKGARCYLAFKYPPEVEPILGSTSTLISVGLGGYFGRALQKGDRVPVQNQQCYSVVDSAEFKMNDQGNKSWLDSVVYRNTTKRQSKKFQLTIRPSIEHNCLSSSQWQKLLQTEFAVHPASNRMGIRLQAETSQFQHRQEILSSALLIGTIQLPPNGQPIIAGVEAQTIGGYPRIAQVVEGELSRLAQLTPGDSVRLQLLESSIF